MSQSAQVKLILFRSTGQMASGDLATTIGNLKDINRFNREAKEWVEQSIAAVKASSTAKPEWSDEDIAQMIIDKIIEQRCQCSGANPISKMRCPVRSLH